MHKKSFRTTLLLSLLPLVFLGCSSNPPSDAPMITQTVPDDSTTIASITKEPATSGSVTKEPTNINTSTDTANTDTPSDEYSIDSHLKAEEIKLGINTTKKRKAAIDELGEEVYWIGVLTAGNYVQTQTCADSPIKNILKQAYPDHSAIDVQLTSDYDGHIIPADYVLANHEEDNDTIIFVHGAGENRRDNTELCKLYLSLGYNVLTYDQRSSGDNRALYCTYGYLEQYDLKQYIEFVRGKISPDKKVLLYAKSQGGATVCRILGSDFGNETIDGAILDCPLTSMRQMIERFCEGYINAEDMDYYFECGDQVLSFFIDGFTMADAEMTEYMKNTTVPTLVLTSKADDIVTMNMPISVYDAIPGENKQLYVSETAYHCGIDEIEPNVYLSTVRDFLNSYLK